MDPAKYLTDMIAKEEQHIHTLKQCRGYNTSEMIETSQEMIIFYQTRLNRIKNETTQTIPSHTNIGNNTVSQVQ